MKDYISNVFLVSIVFIMGIGVTSSLNPKEIKPVVRDHMVALINAERTFVGLSPLSENTLLDISAQKKACDMVDRRYYSHEDPDGKHGWDVIKGVGYHYRFAGENLAEGFKTDGPAMERLMASPLHKKNILSKDFTEVGIGRCGKYIVQHFGRPQ